jgi:hypothetical protein
LALAALVSLALLAAACGGGSTGRHVAPLGSAATQRPSSDPGPASARASGALVFSRCMRSNGVTGYSDPISGEVLRKETPQRLGDSSSQF